MNLIFSQNVAIIGICLLNILPHYPFKMLCVIFTLIISFQGKFQK